MIGSSGVNDLLAYNRRLTYVSVPDRLALDSLSGLGCFTNREIWSDFSFPVGYPRANHRHHGHCYRYEMEPLLLI